MDRISRASLIDIIIDFDEDAGRWFVGESSVAGLVLEDDAPQRLISRLDGALLDMAELDAQSPVPLRPYVTIRRVYKAGCAIGAPLPAFNLKAHLGANGCEFLRYGRGEHQIWYTPATRKTFLVDHLVKSRHAANRILHFAEIAKIF